jgi:hypothetical protein
MSKATPPGPAGAERLTEKVNVVVPALVSAWETSVTVRLGRATAPCGVTERSSIASP